MYFRTEDREGSIMQASCMKSRKPSPLSGHCIIANEPPFTPNIPDHTHRSHSKHQAPRQYVSIGYGVRCLCSPGPGRSQVGGVVPSRGILDLTAVGSRLDLEERTCAYISAPHQKHYYCCTNGTAVLPLCTAVHTAM